jgi:hypothetical protein
MDDRTRKSTDMAQMRTCRPLAVHTLLKISLEIGQEPNIDNMVEEIATRRLRWKTHVDRRDDGRLSRTAWNSKYT